LHRRGELRGIELSGCRASIPSRLPPEEVAKAIVPLCLSDCTESRKIYDFPAGKLLEFRAPA
jgi:hypothetical protein